MRGAGSLILRCHRERRSVRSADSGGTWGAVAASTLSSSLAVPAMVAEAGTRASKRFLDFFADDDALTARPGTAILRARAGLLAISEALTEHAVYFNALAPR